MRTKSRRRYVQHRYVGRNADRPSFKPSRLHSWLLVLTPFITAGLTSMIWYTHGQNLMYSIRPEIVLSDWHRLDEDTQEGPRTTISFGKVCNVGKGSAIRIFVMGAGGNPGLRGACIDIPFLGATDDSSKEHGDRFVVDWNVWANWPKPFRYTLNILYRDIDDRLYRTEYIFLIQEKPTDDKLQIPGIEVAPGVFLSERKTAIAYDQMWTEWRLRLINFLHGH